MPHLIAPVLPLLLGWAILIAGNNLQVVLLPLRAGIEGYSTQQVGVIGGAYYVGFVAGCLLLPALVRRVGHIRAFAAMAAIASCAALGHGLTAQPAAWVALRAATGLCFAGLCLVVESWLNERAGNGSRGRVLSVYMVVNALAASAGQMLLPLSDPAGVVPFAFAAMLISLSLVPVSTSADDAPPPSAKPPLGLRALYRLSPVGVVGCFSLGMVNAAFWTLAPVYAQGRGLPVAGVALMMTAAVMGGAMMQWPLGRLSDRLDRRGVIVGAAVAAAIAGALLAASDRLPIEAVLALTAAFGAAAFPIYALCIAHTNDHLAGGGFVAASSGLLLTFGLGAILGPLAAAALMDAAGGGSLFLFTAALHAALAAFAWHRMRARAPVPADARTSFVALPRTSPALFALDPRADRPER